MRSAGLIFVIVAILASSARADWLYTVNASKAQLERVDTNTLAKTTIGPLGVNYTFGDLAWDGKNLWMVTSDPYHQPGQTNLSLYTVNLQTGHATEVGAHNINTLDAMGWDPTTKTLFAATGSNPPSALYTLNESTGAPTEVASIARPVDGLTFDTKRDMLVGVDDALHDFYQINRTTGTETVLNSGASSNTSGVTYDPAKDVYWTFDYDGILSEYDIKNGFVRTDTSYATGNFFDTNYDSLAFVPSPEPATIALVAMTFAGFLRRPRTSGSFLYPVRRTSDIVSTDDDKAEIRMTAKLK